MGGKGEREGGTRNAAAAATALTIRHSRFATLTLAKLVASLALHPPSSATEADYAPHPSRCDSTPSSAWANSARRGFYLLIDHANERQQKTSCRSQEVLVEHRRFELLTPTLPVLCATSCANAPNNVYIITLQMICKGVKSSFFKFLQKNRISAKAVLSRWTSRLLFSYNETYFFSFIPSLQKWRIPMSKPNILWGCERTKSSSTAPFCTKKETEVSHFAKLRMPQDAAVPYFFTRYV